MEIENIVSSDYWSVYVDCQNLFDCCLPGVFLESAATGFPQRRQVDENYCLYLHINFDFFFKHELGPLMSIFTFVFVCYMPEYARKMLKHYNINGLPSNVCLPGTKECVHLRGHRSETIIVYSTILLTINSTFTHLMLASVFFEQRQTMQTKFRRRRMWRLIRVYTICLQYALSKFELKGKIPLINS